MTDYTINHKVNYRKESSFLSYNLHRNRETSSMLNLAVRFFNLDKMFTKAQNSLNELIMNYCSMTSSANRQKIQILFFSLNVVFLILLSFAVAAPFSKIF